MDEYGTLVEYIDRGKTSTGEGGNLYQLQIFHHKYYMESTGTDQ